MARYGSDLTGMVFGKLTVVSLAHGERTKEGRMLWLCLCSCGQYKKLARHALLSDHTRSCGCGKYLGMQNKASMAGNVNTVIGNYRYAAKKRGIPFALSRENMMRLFAQDCYYCGIAPYRIEDGSSKMHPFVYNGIDRLDPSQGYVPSNVVPCCRPCNMAKLDRPVDEYIRWVLRSAQNLAKKKLPPDVRPS